MDIFISGSESTPSGSPSGVTAYVREALHAGAGERVILYSQAPLLEMDELRALVEVIHDYGQGGEVVAATAHPDSTWRQRLHDQGVTRFWAVAPEDAGGSGRPLDPTRFIEIRAEAICPLLHTLEHASGSYSVCGGQEDRMVLAMHHLRKWCVTRPHVCPWRGDILMKS
ncbi:MAG: hypothetical protein HQM01_15705 [Magnetococcales bacterium]|nr:hypothetical protein [Magnetococcales bacterium]